MSSPDHKTKDFLKKIDQLIERGIIKNHAEVVKDLNWNKSVMSSVKNGALPVPQHIYNKFNETYAEQLQKLQHVEVGTSAESDIKNKYIAILEKRNDDLEKILSRQDAIMGRLTEVEQALSEAKRNQQAMYAFQMGFQDTVLPILGALGQKKAILKEAGERVAAYLEKFQREGISA